MKSAQNTTGFLIRVGDTIMFRVYSPDHSFRDYNILHHDLEVTIVDCDAEFDDLNETLDYRSSPYARSIDPWITWPQDHGLLTKTTNML